MRLRVILSLALILAIAAIFAQVRGFDFINYDDAGHVTARPELLHGLTWPGIRWAFTTIFVGNWIPVTGLTFLADYALYGLDPAGFHITNMLFHAANAVILFLALARMTGALWPSALAAALFSVHPLHVESVAWVSACKDVVSTFFGLLSIAVYARFARTHGRFAYIAACVLFALSLLSKSMLVTLPCVLLLLDFWPLNRAAVARADLAVWRRLAIEKIPFALIAAVIAIVTILVQRGSGAMPPNELLSFSERASNAIVSYIRYLALAIWPVDLIPFYVHPKDALAAWQVAAAVAMLVGVSLIAFLIRHRAPYVLVGWFWFAGTLVPVIGFVQVGGQAMADRYTYVPMIGVFIAFAWAMADFVRVVPRARPAVAFAAVVLIVALGVLAHRQAARWRSSTDLWEYTLKVDADNPVALGNLGEAYLTSERYEETVVTISRALQRDPANAGNLRNLAVAQRRLGHLDEAERLLRRSLEFDPKSPRAYNHLALIMLDRGQFEEADAALDAALAIDSDFLDARVNRGNLSLRRLDLAAAAADYGYVLERRPRDADALSNLGAVRLLESRHIEAVELFERALAIAPRDAVTRTNLAVALQSLGRIDEAKAQAEQALQDNPNYSKAIETLEDLEGLPPP